MKTKLKISTLIFGIIIAVIIFSNSKTFAAKPENAESTQLSALEVEMLEVIEKILDEEDTKLPQEKITKIYNAKSQLVYETKDQDDERLKILLRRSDLVLHTDTSSYYLLGD